MLIFWPGLIVLTFIVGSGFVPKAHELHIHFSLEKTCASDLECTQGVSRWEWRRCLPSFLQGQDAPVPERSIKMMRSCGGALRQDGFQASPST